MQQAEDARLRAEDARLRAEDEKRAEALHEEEGRVRNDPKLWRRG